MYGTYRDHMCLFQLNLITIHDWMLDGQVTYIESISQIQLNQHIFRVTRQFEVIYERWSCCFMKFELAPLRDLISN